MSQNGFDGKITLAAGVNRLVTVLQAAGYQGRFGFTRADLLNQTGDLIYFARRSDVSAANGRPLNNDQSHHFQPSGIGTVDLYQMYVYSAAGGDAYFTGDTR